MKQIFLFWVIGLMSLISFSSCEDKFTYDNETEFMPIGYIAKSPETEDIGEDGVIPEATTIKIMGVRGLIFDEIEKSDWRIVTQEKIILTGNVPLELSSKIFEIEEIKEILDIPTNYESIPVAFKNTTVTYEYLGKPVVLEPIDEFTLSVSIEELSRTEHPFVQYGYIHYTLMLGFIPLKYQKHAFMVLEGGQGDWDWIDDDSDESGSEK